MNIGKQINQANDTQTQRRGFFRRAGIIGVVAALAGSVGWHAYAQGGPGFRGGFFGGPMNAAQMEERTERMLKHLYVEINATPEQQQKLAPIVKQALKDLQPFRAQMQSARAQVISLMSAEQIDRSAIERMRVERLQNAEAASKRFSQALADVAEVLTPAQRKQLAERIQHHRGMMHHG